MSTKNKKFLYFLFAVALITSAFYFVERFTPVKCVDLMVRYGEREFILRTTSKLLATCLLGACVFSLLTFLFFVKYILSTSAGQLRDLIKVSELMVLQNCEKAQKYQSVMRNALEKDLENYRSFLEYQFNKSPSLSLCIALQRVSSLDKEELYLYLTGLAQPSQHLNVFLSICEYLGLAYQTDQLKNPLPKQTI
jgi:hypothetical protein